MRGRASSLRGLRCSPRDGRVLRARRGPAAARSPSCRTRGVGRRTRRSRSSRRHPRRASVCCCCPAWDQVARSRLADVSGASGSRRAGSSPTRSVPGACHVLRVFLRRVLSLFFSLRRPSRRVVEPARVRLASLRRSASPTSRTVSAFVRCYPDCFFIWVSLSGCRPARARALSGRSCPSVPPRPAGRTLPAASIRFVPQWSMLQPPRPVSERRFLTVQQVPPPLSLWDDDWHGLLLERVFRGGYRADQVLVPIARSAGRQPLASGPPACLVG